MKLLFLSLAEGIVQKNRVQFASHNLVSSNINYEYEAWDLTQNVIIPSEKKNNQNIDVCGSGSLVYFEAATRV
jgi:hypothetical protein